MTDVYALEVQTLFRGVPIACKQVVRDGARRRRRRALFVVGSAPRADAPVAPAYLDAEPFDAAGVAHSLVTAAEEDGHFAVRLTPRMAGAVARGDDTAAVAALVRMPPSAGGTFTLRPGDRARVECGAVTFLLASAPRAATIDAAPIAWSSAEMRHHLAWALAVTIALCALLSVPEDPRALALDPADRDHAWARFLLKPPLAPPQPEATPLIAHPAAGAGGGATAAARGPAGAAGSPSAATLPRHAAARGDTKPSDVPRTSPNPAQIAHMSVLAYLTKTEAARAIFTRESAFGSNAADVLGGLTTAPIGDSFGHNGLGPLGTGAGDAGEGDHTIGGRDGGPLATFGKFGGAGGPDWMGHGRAIGALGPRSPRIAPDISTGALVVNGGIDREIIRRTIRRHINEVKFCYEQALLTRPALGGRILVRFLIAPTGQVLTSVVEASTLGHARVEKCTVDAVRRWEFPRPLNGGMVTVSYPFVLTPAASGG